MLHDANKRQAYDLHGHEGVAGTGFRGFSGQEDIFSSFSDLFEDLFGFSTGPRRRTGGHGAEPGADLRYDLVISFEDACKGSETEIEVMRLETCEECTGSGMAKGSQRITCPTCQGRGQIIRSEGFFRVSTVCPHCSGQGFIITNPCPKCRGTGRVKQKRRVKVRIPAGVDTGSRLRLRGEGEAGKRGGPRGDLYIIIHVEAHEIFERRGDDIYCKLPISFTQAALGDRIEVPTLQGPHIVEISPGTQTGERIRIRGGGVTSLRGFAKGDQIVEVLVVTPSRLTERQKELLREFAEIEKEKSEGGFFKKLWKKYESYSKSRQEGR